MNTARLLVGFMIASASAAAGCAPSERSAPAQQTAAQPASNSGESIQDEPSRDLARLKLAEECSRAASLFWKSRGYDSPSRPANGGTETWSYRSHYNESSRRCYVRVELATLLPSGTTTQAQEVFDAVEGGQPEAALYTRTGAPGAVDLLRDDQRIEATPANLDWFRGLMTR